MTASNKVANLLQIIEQDIESLSKDKIKDKKSLVHLLGYLDNILSNAFDTTLVQEDEPNNKIEGNFQAKFGLIESAEHTLSVINGVVSRLHYLVEYFKFFLSRIQLRMHMKVFLRKNRNFLSKI